MFEDDDIGEQRQKLISAQLKLDDLDAELERLRRQERIIRYTVEYKLAALRMWGQD